MIKYSPKVTQGRHFYDLPLLRTSLPDDAISKRGSGTILTIGERIMAVVLDPVGFVAEQINIPLYEALS